MWPDVAAATRLVLEGAVKMSANRTSAIVYTGSRLTVGNDFKPPRRFLCRFAPRGKPGSLSLQCLRRWSVHLLSLGNRQLIQVRCLAYCSTDMPHTWWRAEYRIAAVRVRLLAIDLYALADLGYLTTNCFQTWKVHNRQCNREVRDPRHDSPISTNAVSRSEN